ncbi:MULTISPECIES: DMT family transporter [unclassified Rhizobium]|uniref:DMT family transporter n=1 Tax=unclassified Rhizobium TaxID=2613769 RepID=UPI00104C5619|nr:MULTISPECIES: DMT family transporter [unclassified Rhizobium]TCS04909.1 EamA domain-containing membrane protein RarD [Rhizobium sp. BK418]
MTSMSSTRHPAAAEVTFGLLFMLLSVLISPLIDIFSKLATATISSTEVAGFRFVIQALTMLPFIFLRGAKIQFSLKQSWYHAVRGAMVTISMICFVTTLKVMAVADAIAIFFVEPIILTILGSIFLKETIGWRRYAACAVGFLGAMLIIQPSFEQVGYVALLPVVSAFCIAVFALMTRVLSHREDPWAMQFQTGLWGIFFCAVILYVGYGSGSDIIGTAMPDLSAFGYLLGTGIAAAITGILAAYAYRAAPASTLAPLQYLEIVSATVFAWLVFSDFPDALKWLGILIVIASGLYIIWREQRFASKPVSDTSEVTRAP